MNNDDATNIIQWKVLNDNYNHHWSLLHVTREMTPSETGPKLTQGLELFKTYLWGPGCYLPLVDSFVVS